MSNIGISTNADMQATVSSNTICVVCQDAGGGGIMAATSQGNGWTNGYTGLNTSACPAVVSFQGYFHAYDKDPGGGGIMHHWSTDGLTWSGNEYIGINTSGGCSAVVFNNEIWLFYQESGGNMINYVTITDPTHS